eukprot:781541-Pyramimonas_sp.AAC.2
MSRSRQLQRPEWVGNEVDLPSQEQGAVSVNDHLRADLNAQGVAHETVHVSSEAQRHVAAYLEYERIVGSADNGVMLSEEEYEAFKRKAIEMRKDRLYVTWRCMSNGIDCKSVGPSSKCFCNHMYKQHSTDNMTRAQSHKKDVHCKVPGCRCGQFNYVPGHGTWTIKCVTSSQSLGTLDAAFELESTPN